jgi:hypothetical protein
MVGRLSTDNFVDRLTNHDLVLSNQVDDNAVTTICGDVQVVYRHPDADRNLPPMPDNAFVCRYSMAFGENNREQGKIEVMPFEGENDEWSDVLATPTEARATKRPRTPDRSDSTPPRLSQSTDDLRSKDTRLNSSSSSDSDSGGLKDHMRAGGFDEGTTEKRDIRVGPEHQAIVPAYVLNQKVVSRNPTLVWKRGKISQAQIDQFLERVSAILTPYLRENRLTHEDPYSPLPWDRMEDMVRSLGGNMLPTLSSVCTVSSLSKNKIDILRECDADSLLDLLHKHNYDVKAALAVIEASPRDFLAVWSPQEKELFNSGFRRYSGSLRMICKGIAPSKDFHDVIDYHYRFKIPDQFRRFQDKKREQAVRMMECIETRRNIHNTIPISTERNVGSESAPKKRIKEAEWYVLLSCLRSLIPRHDTFADGFVFPLAQV